MATAQNELLTRISEYQFVCVDLNLYLDTNPLDDKARADYLYYSQMLCDLLKQYEELYGPLQNFGHAPTATGCYVCSEWPWQ